MKFITHIIKNLIPKQIYNPLGRWKTETCKKQINNKIDLANEDHCGPCGQYALTKLKIKK
jgi:hypothetical protein